MSVKVEMLIQVCIGGRPIWRKAKAIRPEHTARLTDKEYDKVLNVATAELATQVKDYELREAAREKEAKKKEAVKAA